MKLAQWRTDVIKVGVWEMPERGLSKMTKYSIGLILVLVLFTWGCEKKQDQIPVDSFQLLVENIIDSDTLIVKQVTLTAHGKRRVSILKGQDRQQGDMSPDPETGLIAVKMVFAADLSKSEASSGNILRMSANFLYKGNNRGIGYPGEEAPVKTASKLDEVMTLKINSGIYPLSEDLILGTVRGEKLILRVK